MKFTMLDKYKICGFKTCNNICEDRRNIMINKVEAIGLKYERLAKIPLCNQHKEDFINLLESKYDICDCNSKHCNCHQ